MKRLWVAVVLLVFAAVCAGDDMAMHMSKVQSSAQWEKMKSLAGAWEGTMTEEGQKIPSKTSFRMTGDGSAIMSTLGEGTPYEMVTMFHTDGPKVMMTHYCAAHNQPRLKAVESKDPNTIAFEFVDATNLNPGEGHMHRVVFTFDGPDHHTEDWTSKQGDKETTGHFDFKRAK